MIIVKHKNYNDHLNESQINVDKKWEKLDGTFVDMKKVSTIVEAILQDFASNFPSAGKVFLHKDIIYTDDPNVETMATDGISIFVNPGYIEHLIDDFGPAHAEFVLIHEAMHVLFDHCTQFRSKMNEFPDFLRVNMAQDYEINYIIENFMREGIGAMPFKGTTKDLHGCYDDAFSGMTWEEIYKTIPSEKREYAPKETTDEWKRGFSDGYMSIMKELKKQNLIERYEIRR